MEVSARHFPETIIRVPSQAVHTFKFNRIINSVLSGNHPRILKAQI